MKPKQKFEDCFREVTARSPLPWQERLAIAPSLPTGVSVPTGCGKTAGIIVAWLWREEFARLVYCLPSRSLVDQTYEVALSYAARSPLPFAVFAMKGGAVNRDWTSVPDQRAIIIGTQEQILSRVLNRGYAMSPYQWPIDFAFLNNDALFVFDEPQAMGAGLNTSIAMQSIRDRLGTAYPTHSIWLSATLPDHILPVKP